MGCGEGDQSTLILRLRSDSGHADDTAAHIIHGLMCFLFSLDVRAGCGKKLAKKLHKLKKVLVVAMGDKCRAARSGVWKEREKSGFTVHD